MRETHRENNNYSHFRRVQATSFVTKAIPRRYAYGFAPPGHHFYRRFHEPPALRARRFRLLLTAVIATTGAAHAAEEPFFEELPLVLSASRLPQPLSEAPGAVTIIDQRLIAATGYRDLARLMRLVAGMQVAQERRHDHWVAYHGLSSDMPTEMQVLIDGRSVITPTAFGGADWSGLPVTLDEIERIEVVRGTNASGFGANAFLGVINIITRHSADATGARLQLRGGSRDLRDGEANWNGSSGPLSLRAAVSTQHDSGFRDLHDSLSRTTATVRGDLQLGTHDTLMVRAAGSIGRRGEGYPDSTFHNNGLRQSRQYNYALHVQWQHTRSHDEEWLLHYYRNYDRARDEWLASAPPAFPAVPLNRNRENVRDNVEFQHRSAPGARTKLVWGFEARRDTPHSDFFYFGGDPDPSHLYRLFGNGEWRATDTLSLNLGISAERYSGHPTRLNPRLFANWQLSPSDTLRVGAARAFRQANLFEQYGDIRAIDPATGLTLVRPFVDSPDLRQTRIDSSEIGYFGRFATWNTQLDVRLFNERIHDFIVRAPMDPAPRPVLADFLGSTRYENLDHSVTLRGIEYQLSTRPARGTELRLAHSIVDVRSEAAEIDKRSAPYTASLSWLQDWGGGWSSMVSALRFGPIAGGDGYVPRFRYISDAYTTVDASLRYATHIGRSRAEWALTAINLGPRHQEQADRSQQATVLLTRGSEEPVNRVSPSVYLTLTLALD